jgi:ABC-type oligopeptide transport system substrate-binding subunit
VLVTAFAAGCGPSSASAHDQSLRLPLYGYSSIPDPARANTPSAVFLTSLLYSGLIKFSPDLHVIPELAVSIPTISSDGLTYTFTVRQDARFPDGTHCTAADVARSLARALSPAINSPAARADLGNIRGARAVEEGRSDRLSGVEIVHGLTLRIRLRRPDASFLEKLALPPGYVVGEKRRGGYPMGTGPWTPDGRQRDGTVVLKPRPHFYGGQLSTRSLLLVPVRDAARALSLYRKGDLDAAEVPAALYGSYEYRSDFHESDALGAYYAMTRGAEGASLAARLNRDTLVASLPGLASLDSVVPPAVPDYVPSPPSLDSSTARLPTVRMVVAPRDATAQALARALARQWLTHPHGSRVQIIYRSYLLPDPNAWLHVPLSNTKSRWYRSVMAQANGLTNDPVTRMSLYSEEESWVLQRGRIVPLASTRAAWLIKPAVQNLQVTAFGLMPQNNNWSLPSVT